MTRPADITEASWRYPGWRVTAASAVASTAGFATILIYTFGAFMKPLSAEFGWSRQIISTAFACASFTLGLCSPGLGYLLDRFWAAKGDFAIDRHFCPCIWLTCLFT
jgi:hypothetical protein